MAFEGLLAKLGPTLVREAAPHLMQMVATFSERFRKDTREIKASVDAEMASIARSHASLASTVHDQSDRLKALQDYMTVLDRRIELLHKAVEASTRQMSGDTARAAKAQRQTRTLVLLATLFSALASGAAITLLVLHR